MSTAEKLEIVNEIIGEALEQHGNGTVELELSEEETDQLVAGLTIYRQELEKKL
jgi:chromosome condensin MukBEF ATPase and DNA-binding subunit MukB